MSKFEYYPNTGFRASLILYILITLFITIARDLFSILSMLYEIGWARSKAPPSIFILIYFIEVVIAVVALLFLL